MSISALIPVVAVSAGGAGCGSWALFRRLRHPAREPVPVTPQPAGVRLLGADEVRPVALRAAASEMHLARRIYERSLHFECLSSSGLGEPLLQPRTNPDSRGHAREVGSEA